MSGENRDRWTVSGTSFLVTIVFLVLLIVGSFGNPVQANAQSSESVIKEQMDAIKQMLTDNKIQYFTANGKACTHTSDKGCANCQLYSIMPNVPSPLYTGHEVNAAKNWPSGTCVAYARWMFYNLFKDFPEEAGSVSIKNARAGDYVSTGGHAGIFYAWADSAHQKFYVYDGNHSMDCKIHYADFIIQTSSVIEVKRSSNNVRAIAGKKLTYSIQGNGTINGVENGKHIKKGTKVQLTSNPDTGYAFSKWTVSGVSGLTESTNQILEFTMPDNEVTVTATFKLQMGVVIQKWDNVNVQPKKRNATLSANLVVDSSVIMSLVSMPVVVDNVYLIVCTESDIAGHLTEIIRGQNWSNSKVYTKKMSVPEASVSDVPGGKRHRYQFSISDTSQLKNFAGTTLTLTPSTTYYYCWTASVNDAAATTEIKSFATTASGTTWETPKIDKNGYFSSWVLYNKSSISVEEVGIFVGTNSDAVRNITVNDAVPNGIEKRTDKGNINSVYDNSKGGTYVFYKPEGFKKISFTPGVTYYYKFYSIDGEGDVVYSSPLSQYKCPGNATQYTLTLKAENGGSIVIGQSGNYAANNVINLYATPQPGYMFKGWSATAGSFANQSNSETSFIMPAQAVTVTARFEQINYALKVTSNHGGVDASVNGNAYHMGDVVTLTAYTVNGYRFVHWTSDNGGVFEDSTSKITRFTMPAGNVNIMAEYESGEETYSLTVTAADGGSVDTSVNGEYHHGDKVIISATPDAGCYFDHWQIDGAVIENSTLSNATVSIQYENVNIMAVFINYDPAWTLNADEGTNIRRAQYNSFISETTTSTEPHMEGWTLVGSTAGEWGTWSDWSTNNISATEDREVEEKDVAAVTRSVYTYTRWKYYNTSEGKWYFTYHGNYGGEKQTKTSNTALSKAGKTTDGVQRYNSTSDPWYNESLSTETVTAAHKEYRYRSRPRTYTYSRTVGSDIWQDGYIEGANVRILYKKDAYNGVLRVPALTTIESEAFAESGITVVLLADGTKTIDERAFADCSHLISVMIPQSVDSIDKSAFTGCHLLTLFVYQGSYGASFAELYGIPYQYID